MWGQYRDGGKENGKYYSMIGYILGLYILLTRRGLHSSYTGYELLPRLGGPSWAMILVGLGFVAVYHQRSFWNLTRVELGFEFCQVQLPRILLEMDPPGSQT